MTSRDQEFNAEAFKYAELNRELERAEREYRDADIRRQAIYEERLKQEKVLAKFVGNNIRERAAVTDHGEVVIVRHESSPRVIEITPNK